VAPASVFAVVRSRGGFSPPDRDPLGAVPDARGPGGNRSGRAAGDSLRAITSRIDRSPSAVRREVAPSSSRGGYRAGDSDDAARRRAQRPKACLLSQRLRLRVAEAQRLVEDWSPLQISGWLRE
jgi:IS30 family transposase